MIMYKENIEAGVDDWLVPLWMKVAVTFFAFSGAVIFVLALLSEQKTLFGLPVGLLIGISLALVLFSIPIVLAFWLFPQSALVLFLYWLIRFLKIQICIFALLGVVYLLTTRTVPFSLRGGIPVINLVLLLLVALLVRPIRSRRFPIPWLARLFAVFEKWISRIDVMPTRVLSSIVAILPILIVCATIYLGLNASLRDYGPYSSWKDETKYWLRIRSFSQVGFNSGYNSPNEVIASAAFNHYGEGNPFYVYLYGSIARFTGWSSEFPILMNFVILALAIFLFTYFTKLDRLQILSTGLIVVLTWPILSYLAMTTQETLNQAIGFILAALFFILLTKPESVRPLTRASFVFLVYLAALVRLSWGLLLIPVIFYALPGKVVPRIVFAVLLGLGLYLSATLITSYLVPPINNSIFSTMENSLVRGPRVLTDRIIDQFSQMLRPKTFNATIAVLFQIATIVGWNTVRLVRLLRSRLSLAEILQSRVAFDLYNMITLTLSGLIFYLHSGFHRTFAPSILLVYLLQAARKDYKFLATLLALNLAFFYSYLGPDTGAARILKADFGTTLPQRAALQSKFEKWIVFDPAVQNSWCNTLLVPIDDYDYRLTLVPPGIGISSILEDPPIQTPFKSKYLLFDRETYERFADRLNAKLLDSFPVGDLYYNLDSGCTANY